MFKKVLCLSPHTDDCEIGCGGTIARFIEEGRQVLMVAFSTLFDAGDLKTEAAGAATALGAKFLLLEYPVRRFSENRQEILDKLLELNKDFYPDLVLLPSTYDTHQDHQVISEEAFRTFKMTSMWGYEVPRNNLNFPTRGFVALKERHIKKKIEAISYYESQNNRSYTNPEFIKSLATVRGVQINAPYAETFEIIRWMY